MIYSSNSSHLRVNSLLGNLDFNRYMLHCRKCGQGYAPFDKELEIDDNHKVTKGLKETVTDFAQMMPFAEVKETLKKHLGIEISAATIQKISESIGKELFEKEKKEARDIYENQYKAISNKEEANKKGRLYIECDGSMLLIRVDGWKEIKLGMVFSDNMVLNKNKPRHIIAEKEYVAYLGSAEEFKKMLWAAAVRNGIEEVKEVVIIGDGATWIWNMADELFPEAIRILDYYHFNEHVHECGKVIYGDDEVNKARWVRGIIDKINEGKIEETINNIKTMHYENEEIRSSVNDLVTYLENNKDRIKYKEYKDKGYFIGSGAIEGGNKCVIQNRLKQAGMRWNKDGVQYIASLRTAKKSNQWDKVKQVIYGNVG